MPWFVYEAERADGEFISGRIEAPDVASAASQLETKQLRVRAISAVGLSDRGSHADTEPRSELSECRSVEPYLQELLEASRGLAAPLRAYAEESSGRTRRQLLQVAEDLETDNVTQVLQRGRQFPPFLISALSAAADPERASDSLSRLLDQIHDGVQLQKRWANNLAYPTVLLLVLCLFAVGMWVWVVPQFRQIYDDFQTELPLATLLILNARPVILFVACLIPICLLACWLAQRCQPGWWPYGLAYRLPIVGRTLRYAALARFAQLTAALAAVKAPLVDAVRAAARATLPDHLAFQVERLTAEEMSSAFTTGWDVVPATLALALQPHSPAAREIGTVRLLRDLAQDYEARALARMNRWGRSYEPLFVLLIGGCVGFTVLALFLPLVSLIQNLSG